MTEAASPEVAASGTGPFRRLSAGDAWDLLLGHAERPEQLLVLDLRDEPSFARAHLDGARRLTQALVPELLSATPKTASVVVYCYHGHASQAVAGLFGSSGFDNAFSVDGGFEALAKEHARRSSSGEERPRPSATAERFIVGDCVYAREAIQNDGGMPELAGDALVAAPGTRGVVVQVGHTEADPQQILYAVRFELADGTLGPVVGCLPEELSAAAEQSATRQA